MSEIRTSSELIGVDFDTINYIHEVYPEFYVNLDETPYLNNYKINGLINSIDYTNYLNAIKSLYFNLN